MNGKRNGLAAQAALVHRIMAILWELTPRQRRAVWRALRRHVRKRPRIVR